MICFFFLLFSFPSIPPTQLLCSELASFCCACPRDGTRHHVRRSWQHWCRFVHNFYINSRSHGTLLDRRSGFCVVCFLERYSRIMSFFGGRIMPRPRESSFNVQFVCQILTTRFVVPLFWGSGNKLQDRSGPRLEIHLSYIVHCDDRSITPYAGDTAQIEHP